jgi:MFS family permease
VPRLTRDRVTLLIYAQLSLWGFYIYGLGPVVPLLRDEQGTSTAVAGLHSTGVAVGTLLGGFLYPILSRRIGRARLSWVAIAGVAAGVIVLCTVRPLAATLSIVVVISVFGTILVTGVNAMLSAKHGSAAPAALSEANAVGAALGIVSPLLIGAAVGIGFGWRPALGVEVILILGVVLAAVVGRIRLPSGGVQVTVARRSSLSRGYWIAWTLLVFTASIEVCLSLWSADVLRSHAGMSPGAASAAVASVMVGMFLGRVVGGRLALRVAPPHLLLGAFAVSLAGFVVFWVSPVPVIAVAGLIILGLGNAMHYPLGIALAMAAAPDQTDRASAYTAYAIGIGFGVAPVALGAVADAVGDPRLAFLLLPAFLALAALMAYRLRRAPATPAAPPGEVVDLAILVREKD